MEFTPTGVYSFQKELKRTEQSLAKRLKSIEKDAMFLSTVFRYFDPLPRVANLRCGLWYQKDFDSTCYFKSTDGHYGTWAFNLGRNNFHVIELCVRHGGAVLVDSTRKGKLYPDSFSRTVPIWVGVVNAILLRRKDALSVYAAPIAMVRIGGDAVSNREAWETFVMPTSISSSEVQQVQKLIPGYVAKIMEINLLTFKNKVLLEKIDKFALELQKPLRCLLFNPASQFYPISIEGLPFSPLVCLSASEAQTDASLSPSGHEGYIQGAGDDEEAWALGLAPRLFWDNVDALLHTDRNEDEIRELAVSLVSGHKERSDIGVSQSDSSAPLAQDGDASIALVPKRSNPETFIWIAPTKKMALCSDRDATTSDIWNHFTAYINCSEGDYLELNTHPNYLHLPIAEGKTDKNRISRILPIALNFMRTHLAEGPILIHCYYALAGFLNFFDTDGNLLAKPRREYTKDFMRTMQYYVTQFCIDARISRTSSNDLNRFFMSPLHGPGATQQYWKQLPK